MPPHLLRQLIVISALAGVLVAQAPSAAPSSTTAAPQTLPAGTVIRLHNASYLASQFAQAGDPASFEVVEAIESDGLVIIPKHAIARGKIVKSERSHWGGRSGHLAISIEEVQTITGALVKVRPYVEPKQKEKTSIGDVLGGLLLLPFALAAAPTALIVPGDEKLILPGSDFSVQTIDPLPLDIPVITKSQREDPFAAAYAEVVFFRPLESGYVDRETWKVDCGGEMVASLEKEHFVRFFLPTGDYWLKTEGRTIAFEKRESPKAQAVHLAPNSQYVFQFTTWSGNMFSKGPHGFIGGPRVDIGDAHFWELQAGPVYEFKRKDTLDDPKPLACQWKKGEPFSQQRRNGFAVIDGTPIELRFMEDWSSSSAKLGDKVSLAFAKDLEVRGMPILRAGAPVDAIVSVPPYMNPRKYKGGYELVIANLTLPDGQHVRVRLTEREMRPYFRSVGARIVTPYRFAAPGSPYIISKGSSVQLAHDTVVTIFVEGNYLLDPAQVVQETPVETLKPIQ